MLYLLCSRDYEGNHRRLKHAGHYLGYTSDSNTLTERLITHRLGRGAHLTRAMVRAGLLLECTAIFAGDRSRERQLKQWHNLAKLCPDCNPPKRRRFLCL